PRQTSPRATHPPHTSEPAAAENSNGRPGLNPSLSKYPVTAVRPSPPNQPNSFCAPCAAIMRPSTIRATNNPASAIVHLQNHNTILYIVTTCQVVTWAGTMRGPMGERSAETPELCRRFHHASELIGRRWTGAIIFVLLASRC